MNEIIQNLECNATNGKENFCYISEKKLLAIKELSKRKFKENTNLKQALNKIRDKIKILGKFDGEKCTRNFKMMSADFNYVLQIIDKVLGDDEK